MSFLIQALYPHCILCLTRSDARGKKKKPKQKPQVTKQNPSPLKQSIWVSTRVRSIEKFRASRSCRKRCDPTNLKYRDSLKRSRRKRKSDCRSLLFSGIDSSLKTLMSYSSGPCSSSRFLRTEVGRRMQNACNSEEKLEVIRSEIHRLRKKVYYSTYCPTKISTKYDRSALKFNAKIAHWITAQTKSHTFSAFDPIGIIVFLNNLKLGSDTIEVYRGTAM